MRTRGVGYGTALAIIVMTIIILMGMYKITETYIKSEVALQKYSEAIQKPRLRISSVLVKDTGIDVTLVNDGPGGVYVKNVYIYKENSEGIPTEAIPADLESGSFLPLGGRLIVHFTVTDTENYVFWNKPLRILVETDKGIIDLAFRQPTTRVYINVHLPAWLAIQQSFLEDVLNELELDLFMPSQVPISHYSISLGQALHNTCSNPQTLPPPPHFGYYVCLSEDRTTVTVYLDVISGMEYEVKLHSSGVKLPIIMQSIDAVRTGPVPWLGFYFQTIPISYTSRFAATPGSSVEVDFKIPDVTWRNTQVPLSTPSSTSHLIDFSWIYKAIFKDEGYSWGEVGHTGVRDEKHIKVSPGGWTLDPDEVWRAIFTVAGNILATGTITSYSPAGCIVYPTPISPGNLYPNVPDRVKDYVNKLLASQYKGDYDHLVSVHSGIPFIVYDIPQSCIDQSNPTLLKVTVNFHLDSGRYIIIPIFSYDDQDIYTYWGQPRPGLKVAVSVNVYDNNGVYRGGSIAVEGEDDVGRWYVTTVLQGATPITIQAPTSGTYKLILKVDRIRPIQGDGHYIAAFILSKILIIPYSGSTDVCMYKANQYPGMPWVVVDLSQGTVERYSVALAMPMYQVDYPPPSEGAVADAIVQSQLILYRGSYETSAYIDVGTVNNIQPYQNNLPTTIKYEITADNQGSSTFRGFIGGIGVRIQSSDTVISPFAHSSYSTEVMYADELVSHGFTFVVIGYYDLPKIDNQPDRHVYVTIKFKVPYSSYGSSTYYILIPYKFLTDYQYEQEPTVQVTGGSTEFIQVGNDEYEKILVVTASAGSQVTIKFDLGTPAHTGMGGYGDVHTFLGIGGIVVLKDPNSLVSGSRANIGAKPNKVGLILNNIRPSGNGVPAYLRIFDAKTGDQVGDPISLNTGAQVNIVSIRYLDGFYSKDVWTYPYHDLYIVVEGVQCTPQT